MSKPTLTKDIWHNTHNPRGYGLFTKNSDDDDSCVGRDAVEDGWDGHKNAF